MKTNLLPALCLSAALLIPAAAANATASVTYTTLGMKSTFAPGYNNINGPADAAIANNTYPTHMLAVPFTPKVTGHLDHLDLAVSKINSPESGQNGVIVSIATDNGKASAPSPVQPLETFLNDKLKLSPTAKVTKFASKLHPMLTAGTTYWVVVQSYGLNNLSGWNQSFAAGGQTYTSQDGGTTWADTQATPEAFDVWVGP